MRHNFWLERQTCTAQNEKTAYLHYISRAPNSLFRLGLRLRPRFGNLQRSPDIPLTAIRGLGRTEGKGEGIGEIGENEGEVVGTGLDGGTEVGVSVPHNSKLQGDIARGGSMPMYVSNKLKISGENFRRNLRRCIERNSLTHFRVRSCSSYWHVRDDSFLPLPRDSSLLREQRFSKSGNTC